MGYKRLSESDSQGHAASDFEDDPIFTSKRQVSISIVTLIGLSSTTLISVLTLLVLFLLRESRHSTWQNDGWTFSARFEQNTSRMSLDHQYDYLWDDWLTKGLGIISTSETVGDRNDGAVGLSMYVCRWSRYVFLVLRLFQVPPDPLLGLHAQSTTRSARWERYRRFVEQPTLATLFRLSIPGTHVCLRKNLCEPRILQLIRTWFNRRCTVLQMIPRKGRPRLRRNLRRWCRKKMSRFIEAC